MKIDPKKVYTAYQIQKQGLLINHQGRPCTSMVSIRTKLLRAGHTRKYNKQLQQSVYQITGEELIELNQK